MFTLLDNLNAVIIGAVVVLILIGLRMRMAEISTEEAAAHFMKTQANDLATWMEEDLLMMGQNIDSEDVPFKDPQNAAGITEAFIFYRDSIDADGDVVRIETRYKLKKSGERTVDGEKMDLYRIEREQRMGNGAWKPDGASPALLSYFKIDMLNRDVDPVDKPASVAKTHPDSVRNTRVRFTLVTPFDKQRSTFRQLHYGSTLLIANK